MRLEDIKRESLADRLVGADGGVTELLPGEISGVTVRAFELSEGSTYTELPKNGATVIIVCRGGVVINGILCDGRGLFAFAEETQIDLKATKSSLLLYISFLASPPRKTSPSPYFIRYDDAVCYKEDCKSEKTVSRMLLPEGLIQNLAIGSVETSGPDAVAAHEHPFCDQLFFSFEENKMNVEIEDLSVPMEGNVLLHIPLGSSHGVDVPKSGYAHYLWIDFIVDSRGIEYMKTAHKTI